MKTIYKKAFTLVELLIVIAILGILAVGLLVALDPVEQTRRATDTGALTSSGEVKAAVNRFYASKQYFPWCTPASAGTTCTFVGTGCTADSASFLNAANSCGIYTVNQLTAAGELKTAPPASLTSRIKLNVSGTGTAFQLSFVPSAKSYKTTYPGSSGQPGVYNTNATTPCSTATVGDGTNCPSTSTTCEYCVF